jgi:hypothetical protein
MKIFWTTAIYALSMLTASPLLFAPVANAQALGDVSVKQEVRRMLRSPKGEGGGGKDDKFYLKMDHKRDLCMECGGNKCNKGDYVYLRKCDKLNTEFEFDKLKGDKVKIRVYDTDMCLDIDRKDGYVKVDKCKKTSDQIFEDGKGDFDKGKFELVWEDKYCLSADHPSFGEKVKWMDCDKAHKKDMNFWKKD